MGGKKCCRGTERRAERLEIVEDVVPLHDVTVTLREDAPMQSVHLAPQGVALPFERIEGRIRFVVPLVLGHQMVEVG